MVLCGKQKKVKGSSQLEKTRFHVAQLWHVSQNMFTWPPVYRKSSVWISPDYRLFSLFTLRNLIFFFKYQKLKKMTNFRIFLKSATIWACFQKTTIFIKTRANLPKKSSKIHETIGSTLSLFFQFSHNSSVSRWF